MLSLRPRSKQNRERRQKFRQSKSLSLSESMEVYDPNMPNITATKGSFKHFAQTVARFQALRSRRNTSDDLLGMAARQQRSAPPKFQRMNSVMNFGIKEDLGLSSSPPPVNKNQGSGSPSASSTSLNKSTAQKPFIPPQPPLQPKLNTQTLPGLDKRVWKKLPISYFQFVFIGIALFVAAVILLYTPSKLAKSRHSQQFQNGRASTASGWRNPYVVDYKSLTDNVVCQIEQFSANDITQDIFTQLLQGSEPKILVPEQGVNAWSPSTNLWHFESMVRSFGSMRVHYEEYTASRGSLSGKMLLEEAMGRFKTSQDNLETSNIKTYGNFGKHLHFTSFISSQKMNQIEMSVGETWHKDYLTVESVTAIVQGARRWLFYKGLKEDIQDITRKWFEEKYLDLGKKHNIQECIQHIGDLLHVPSGYIALYVDIGDTVAFTVSL